MDVDHIVKRLYWVNALRSDRQLIQLALYAHSADDIVDLLESNGYSRVKAIAAGPISLRHIEHLD
jgi:hypothetical protein